jgi:putative transposase
MLRCLGHREEAPGAIQHAIAKGSGGESIVRDDGDRNELLSRIGVAVQRHRWSCLAYCLMNSHFHLLVGTPVSNLGAGMQWLLSSYARYFNKRHTRDGNLFHSRFYSTRVKSEEHLTSALVYVLLNPVRAGLVDQPDRWRWSSYAATIGTDAAPPFLDRRAALELIDEHPASARRRLALAVREARELDHMRTAGVRRGV